MLKCVSCGEDITSTTDWAGTCRGVFCMTCFGQEVANADNKETKRVLRSAVPVFGRDRVGPEVMELAGTFIM